MFRVLRGILIVASVAVSAAPARGQTQEAAIAAQRARIDSMLPEYWRLSREVYYADSLKKANERMQKEQLDTLVLHPFVIVARKAEAHKIFSVMRSAIEAREDIFNGLSADARVTLLVEWHNAWAPAFREMAKRPRHRLVAIYGDTRGVRARYAANAVDDALMEFLPVPVRTWILDQNLARGRDRIAVFRQMATSRSDYATRCFAGAVDSCLRALEFAGQSGPARGHTGEQLAALARDYGVHHDPYVRQQCIRTRDVATCVELFRSYGGPPAPISPAGRASFVMYAVENGARGTLARLAQSNARRADAALATASGREIGELVEGWRKDLERERSVVAAGVRPASAAALAWALLALAVALRSTRRRAE